MVHAQQFWIIETFDICTYTILGTHIPNVMILFFIAKGTTTRYSVVLGRDSRVFKMVGPSITKLFPSLG